MKETYNAIDLFCGCGGVTSGLKDAGFTVLAGIDVDETILDTYKMNHPEVVIWNKDISKINPREILTMHKISPGSLDLLVGCPPCQGFSKIKKLNRNKSIKDKRKDLIYEFMRFIQILFPKTIMLENVPGLLDDYRMRNRFLPFIRKLGYYGVPQVFDAKDYGVPQRRKRLILIASRVGDIPYAQPGIFQIQTVRTAIGDMPLAGSSGDPLHDFPENRTEKVKKIISQIPVNGGSRNSISSDLRLKCHTHNPRAGFNDIYGRMKWDDVSPTITGGCTNPSKGRFLHPELDRAITLREAALLQSFSRDYKFSLKRGKDYASLMIGNAFPPKLVYAHAKEIFQALRLARSHNV